MPTEPNPTEVIQARVAQPPPPVIEFTGVITSRKSRMIPAQIQARIEQLNIHSGQVVKAGELLAQLDDTELKTKVEQAQGQEKSAVMEAGAYGAQAAGLRDKMIAERRGHALGVSPAMAVTTARAEYAQVGGQTAAAMARAVAAKATREQAEKDLAKARIYAPIDGVITGLKAHQGEIAQAGSTLARVFDPSEVIVRFAVPKEHRRDIHLGQHVELTIDGDQRIVRATVSSIPGAQEPPLNFTVVDADIDNPRLVVSELSVSSIGRVRIPQVRGAER